MFNLNRTYSQDFYLTVKLLLITYLKKPIIDTYKITKKQEMSLII